jgi:hypothetical protein
MHTDTYRDRVIRKRNFGDLALPLPLGAIGESNSCRQGRGREAEAGRAAEPQPGERRPWSDTTPAGRSSDVALVAFLSEV